MRIIPLLIILSLTANLLLGVMLWRQERPKTRSDASTTAQVKQSRPSTASIASRATSSVPKPAPLWTGLKSDSIEDAINRLRAAGCPPREIAAAARAMIDNLRMERYAALGYANETLPYWKQFRRFDQPRPHNEFDLVSIEHLRLQRTHLLSPDLYAADEGLIASDRLRFGNLDTEKLRRLSSIELESREKRLQAMSAGGSTQAGAAAHSYDRKHSEQLQKEQDAAIKATLTSDEYAQYELRSSPIANSLRAQLESFRPTENEYKALFAIEKTRRAQPETGPLTAEQQQAARTQYEADVLAALGPERAADLDALQKAGSNLLPRLIARLDLPLVTVSVLNTVRSETGAQAKAIMNDQQLSPSERTAQLNALIQKAESRLNSVLGSTRAVEAYKDLKGEWIRALKPQAGPGGP